MKQMKKLVTIFALFITVAASAQSPARSWDTTMLTNLGTSFNVAVSVPANFYSQPTWKWDGIIYLVGQGEMGTDTSLMRINGPHDYLKVWNGVVHQNTTQDKTPVIVTLQEPSFYNPAQMIRVIDSCISNFHMFPGNVSIWGISLGSQLANRIVMYQATNGVSLYGGRIRSIVNVIGEKPDQDGAGLPYASCFAAWAALGGREAAFEQAFDARDLQTIVDTLNHTLNKSFYFQTNYGGGGHCCWQNEYGDHTGTVPLTYNFGGRVQNVYQWALTQGLDTNATYHAGVNTPPTGSGGPRQTIQLPTSSVTLAGTATGTNGATIASTAWSWYTSRTAGKINPSHGTITDTTSLTTTITGFDYWGNNMPMLVITDSHGLKDTVYTTINVLPAHNPNPGRRLTIGLTQTNPGEVFRPTTAQTSTGALPGDTIIIPRNNGIPYDLFRTGTISGAPGQPITIMGDSAWLVRGRFVMDAHSQYLRYDLQGGRIVGGTGDAFDGLQFNHIEIKNFNVDSVAGGAGFLLKTIADTSNLETIFPNYPLTNLYVHDGVVQNTHDNGGYIGTTNPSGLDAGQPPGVPPRMDSVRVSHVTMNNIGQTAISVSAAGNGMSIDSNTVTNVGTRHSGTAFSVGIEMGGSTTGNIYGNYMKGVWANGIEVFAYGTVNEHDNVMDSVGINTGSDGHEATFANDPLDLMVSNPPMQWNVYNNTILHAYPGAAAIHAYNGNGTMPAANVHNNTICIPTGANVGGLGYYIIGSPTPITASNSLTTVCSAVSANAGPDQVITLPTSSATLNGTGSIGATTYLWTKISGPGATTILNNSTATPTATGLLQGVYVFQLSINSGASTDQVQITVNPAIITSSLKLRKRFKLK